jgi:hypothetical protein
MEKVGDDHVMAEKFAGRGLCSLRASKACDVANSAKPLKIRRKRHFAVVRQRYDDERNSSHSAQNPAVKLAKLHRRTPLKV